MNTTLMKFPTKVAHALDVINLYFTLRPDYWMYEPKERFEHDGERYVWAPDCVFVHAKKVYACEVQLSPLSASRWAEKWSVYNTYFSGGFFKQAAFQAWSSKTIMPQFLCVTTQQPDTVRTGFAIAGRELIVTKSL